ncbi:dTDP-glucose 4,6-dehydratase [Streptomyces sp. PsTaAH-130]|nr:dTDP-glucose 4,6-dehydratase [Streptomyces sp. PsTaAH-130]
MRRTVGPRSQGPLESGARSVRGAGCLEPVSTRKPAGASKVLRMRILVTGGAGFIGSAYVRTLLDGGYPGCAEAEVTVLDALTYAGNTDNLPLGRPRLDFVRGDITDTELLRSVVPGHDWVVHFAAESHVDRSVRGAAAFARTNVLGTQSLLDACLAAGVDRFVHVSTDEVYGSIDRGSWTEDSPLLPNSPYAASKASSDLMARAYWRTHGLDVRITRCSNNYGPYQHVEKLVPLFVTRLLTGGTLPLYGDGTNVREWIHVEDHCRAVHLVLTGGRAGEVYNIGGGTALTNRRLTELLLGLCDAGWDRVRHVEDRKGHDLRYAIDDAKIRAELGWRPRVSFEEGLSGVVEWYRANPAWWKSLEAAR